MGDYRSLKVWQRAHLLTLQVYEVTGSFPKSEQFGLTSQIRRAASSIPANLAEGCGRNSDPELGRFGRIALGSASELDYHLLLARDLGLMDPEDHSRIARELAELKRMIARLVKRLTDS